MEKRRNTPRNGETWFLLARWEWKRETIQREGRGGEEGGEEPLKRTGASAATGGRDKWATAARETEPRRVETEVGGRPAGLD